MTVSPNPAARDLAITISDESPEVKALKQDEKVLIQLYEFSTHLLVKQWNFKNTQNQFSLNVRNLRKGQYILVLHKGAYKESKTVLIGQ